MVRLTERNGSTVVYTGIHTKLPGLDCAGTMKVAAQREVMDRLAAYEDTGLTPEEMEEFAALVSKTARGMVQSISETVPHVLQAVRVALQNMTPEQITELLQASLRKN